MADFIHELNQLTLPGAIGLIGLSLIAALAICFIFKAGI